MAHLTGGARPIDLGQGFEILAPGITGEAKILSLNPLELRAHAVIEGNGTQELDHALRIAGLTEQHHVELNLHPVRAAGLTGALRSADGRQEVVALRVPAPAEGMGQIVLASDEAGILTWHLPVGSGATRSFLISASRPAPPARGTVPVQRGLIGLAGRKLVKVLSYPLVEPLLGPIEMRFAERWERMHRPYGVRTFTSADYRDSAAHELAPRDWERLAAGRALLFIHGTFSTSHAAFWGIPVGVMDELGKRYGDRVFAFNHFTLSHDPARNASRFLESVPAGRKLEVDIVCHSRGGLVARALAERPSVFGIDASRLAVRRIVFAGVPNAGTQLAQADHLVQMVDRLTNLVIAANGPAAEFLVGMITSLKVLAHAGLGGLPGLAAMDPFGRFLSGLNRPVQVAAEGYAIAADFEPGDEGLRALVTGTIADAVMDRVFGEVANDLVVPQPAVFAGNGSSAFPIPEERLLKVAAKEHVMHTTLFQHAPVTAKLLEWLQ